MVKRDQSGNKYGLKLKDPNVRQEAFKQYCEHLASGYPREAFFFEHPVHSVCWETIEKYIEENPQEFPPIKIKQAMARRYRHWLDKGRSLMEGKFRGGSPTVWTVCMRNLFKDIGWDKEDKEEKHHHETDVDKILNEWEQDGAKPQADRQPE